MLFTIDINKDIDKVASLNNVDELVANINLDKVNNIIFTTIDSLIVRMNTIILLSYKTVARLGVDIGWVYLLLSSSTKILLV